MRGVNRQRLRGAAINGIRLQSGPIPKSRAITGETAAMHSPDERPQVITEMISTLFLVCL